MKDFSGLVLCSYSDERVSVCVSAGVSCGRLRISGEECGKATKDFWGSSDYEYGYSFDEAETEKLFQALGAADDPEKALQERFSGLDGCRKLREFCGENGIEYRFSSYV